MAEATNLGTPALSPRIKEEKAAALGKAKEITTAIRVTDAASMATAEQWLQVVLKEKDALEEMRVSVTKPINQSLRGINSWFKPLRESCEAIERHLKGEVAAYLRQQRALADAQYQAAAVAHQAGNHEVARQALVVASTSTTEAPKSMTVSERWSYYVIDPDKVPREFLIVDTQKLNAHCRLAPGQQEPVPVPGVSFRLESSVIARRAK